MSEHSSIEWTEATWNPITGCSVTSAGCKHCYAMKLAGGRLQHHPSRAGLTIASANGPVWNGEVRLNREWLSQPIEWKRPRRIFVCAHGDLFHESVPDAWIDLVFEVMGMAHWHTFQVLTKRAKRMREYMDRRVARGFAVYSHVWLGVSAEDQERARERIVELAETPAAVRWVSAEPLLGEIDLACEYLAAKLGEYPFKSLGGEHRTKLIDILDWVVVGGESGPHARPMHPDWARSLRDQCAAAGVAFLFKQWGEWKPCAQMPHSEKVASSKAYLLDDTYVRLDGSTHTTLRDDHAAYDASDSLVRRVGKKAAGRLLDGIEHNGYPEMA